MAVLPVKKRKVGQELYSCVGFYRNGKACSEIWSWVIRSIRRPKRTKAQISAGATLPILCVATAKNNLTFNSGKWNDSLINNNADIYKKEWCVEKDMPEDLATTVNGAVRVDIASTKEYIATLESVGEQEEAEEMKKILSVLKRRQAKLKAN